MNVKFRNLFIIETNKNVNIFGQTQIEITVLQFISLEL